MGSVRTYGIPYCGSKNLIAEKVVESLPAADTLVDLFAGGCAVTHAAILSGKWKRFVANDINALPSVFADFIAGRRKVDCSWWVSREEFELVKRDDPLTAAIWSFSGNCCNYLYSYKAEPYKRALHNVLTLPTVTERRLAFRVWWRELLKLAKEGGRIDEECSGGKLQHLTNIERLGRLCDMENVERLQNVGCDPDRLKVTRLDYREVELPPNCVVYCDPPYRGTQGYNGDKSGRNFDNEAFWTWAARQTVPLFISEVRNYDTEHFETVWERRKDRRNGSLGHVCHSTEVLCRLKATTTAKPAMRRLPLSTTLTANTLDDEKRTA